MKRIRNPFKGRASALGQRLTGRIRNRLVTDTLREVHHTFPRFLSLLVLGVGSVLSGRAAGHCPGYETLC